MNPVRFGGVYQITRVQNTDGSTPSAEQQRAAMQRFFYRPHGTGDWHGKRGGGLGSGRTTVWLSATLNGKHYVAIDDEQGADGTRLSEKADHIARQSRFTRFAWKTYGIHFLARAYVDLKEKFYVAPRQNKAFETFFRNAQPAEVLVKTKPRSWGEDCVVECRIQPL